MYKYLVDLVEYYEYSIYCLCIILNNLSNFLQLRYAHVQYNYEPYYYLCIHTAVGELMN